MLKCSRFCCSFKTVNVECALSGEASSPCRCKKPYNFGAPKMCQLETIPFACKHCPNAVLSSTIESAMYEWSRMMQARTIQGMGNVGSRLLRVL
ncbi:hypothetical protein L596_005786 [Steinernema carpocapsae]|uniref:Uncharacterized protein n=1 Tax=Steinernema carpocapsae TaxID=34508 RepID=A0A4U8V041_STECR|nr:hypothetical protein L596_005786 [Steinernema carpocapsae]